MRSFISSTHTKKSSKSLQLLKVNSLLVREMFFLRTNVHKTVITLVATENRLSWHRGCQAPPQVAFVTAGSAHTDVGTSQVVTSQGHSFSRRLVWSMTSFSWVIMLTYLMGNIFREKRANMSFYSYWYKSGGTLLKAMTSFTKSQKQEVNWSY